jgi:glycosyl transferase family 25
MLFETYVILLEKDIKRVDLFEFNKKNFNFINKFSALNSKDNYNDACNINKINNFNKDIIVNDKLKGKLGCNLSHQLLWEKCLYSNCNWFLILEDDVLINNNNNNIIEIINKIIEYSNINNNDFIQLDIRKHHLNAQCKFDMLEINNLFKMKPQCGLGSYLLNKKCINYFKTFYPFEYYIDVYTNDLNHINNLNSLCYVNNIFINLGKHREIDNNSKLGSNIYE